MDPTWWMVQNTLIVLLLLPAVLVLCRVFARRPAVAHALWAVLLVKLLTPAIVVWPWTAQDAFELLGMPSFDYANPVSELPLPEGTQQQIIVASDTRSAPPVSKAEPEALPAAAQAPLPPGEIASVEPQPPSKPAAIESVLSLLAKWPQVSFWIMGVWLSGAAITLIAQAHRILKLRRVARNAGAPSPWLAAEIQLAAALFKVRPPAVLRVEGIRTPLVW
jgi:hypothetical protein